MDTWIKHSNAVLAAMDNGGYKNSPATRACGYVCCIVCCSPCTVWSSVWRIVACLFRGPGYMCDGNECTKYTDKCICFCIEAVEAGEMTKDLAILIDRNTPYLHTEDFLDAIDRRLQAKMA